MNSPGLDAPYWSQDARALSTALGSSPGGLSSETAAAKLRVVGPNSIEDAARLTALRLLFRKFESPLVLILIFAAVVSLVLQQWVDFGNHFGDRARKRTAWLLSGVPGIEGCRGTKTPIGANLPGRAGWCRANSAREHVVPGDLILLLAGNLIPADGLVIEAADFLVSEASMTGEC